MKSILDKKNVVGFYRDNGKFNVLVEKKVPLSDLDPKDIIPKRIGWSDTDVIEQSIPEAHYYEDRIKGSDPYMAGIAIRGSDTGTAGLIFFYNGEYCLLTNSHVGANLGASKEGSLLVETATGRKIASLKKASSITTFEDYVKWAEIGRPIANTDACYATMQAIHEGCRVLGLPYPKGVRRPAKGMNVSIAGRTSGVSRGIVMLTDMTMTVRYKTGLGVVANTFKALNASGKGMAQLGDSGACYFDEEGYVVGIHYAGDTYGSYGVDIMETFSDLGINSSDVSFPLIEQSENIDYPKEEAQVETNVEEVNYMILKDQNGYQWELQDGIDNKIRGEGAGRLFDKTDSKALFWSSPVELFPVDRPNKLLSGLKYKIANDTIKYPDRALLSVRFVYEGGAYQTLANTTDLTPFTVHEIVLDNPIAMQNLEKVVLYGTGDNKILQLAELEFVYKDVGNYIPLESNDNETASQIVECQIVLNGVKVGNLTIDKALL